MRTIKTMVAIFALVFLLPACGGKKTQEPTTQLPDVSEGEGMTVERTPDTEIGEEDVEVVDEGIGVGDEGGISERALSDMTLEEINAAEFLKNIYFDFDKYDLRDDAVAQLNANARWIKEHDSVRVIIEGHCDERGTEEYNLALGERRAKAARSYLVRLGVTAHRMMTVSYGESQPMDPGHTEFAWAKNRRAHFRVIER